MFEKKKLMKRIRNYFIGSGKSCTMFGYENAKGILRWFVEKCLVQSPLHVSALEIADANTYDLSKRKKNRLNSMDKPSAKKIKLMTEFNTLLEQVLKLRTQKPTNQNLSSSRTHLIFVMTMEGQATNPIVFVDLAGFESPKDKENIDETKFINKSLFDLNQVLVNISQNKIPNFNANPLTKFLKPFLNAKCHTQMLYHVKKDSIKFGLEYIMDIVASQKDSKRKVSNAVQKESKIPKREPIRN